MKKFVILDSQSFQGADFNIEKNILEDAGIECIVAKCKTNEEVIDIAKDADGVASFYVDLNKDLINELKKCKVIVRYGIGVDSVDIDAATKKGIAVCNIPNYCQEEVATHTMALLLDIARKTSYFDRMCRNGEWNPNAGYDNYRLSSMTLGLVGFGSIPRLLSKYMSGFGMKIIAYDPYISKEYFDKLKVRQVSLNDLYKESDIISVHTPLTPETKHLINEESINKMKDGVFIINTARGPIIKIDDLINALKKGKVKAAGLDVVENEPIEDADAEIFKLDNIVITPHTAFNSADSAVELQQKVAKSAVNVLSKNILPDNVVNKKDLA